MVGLVQGSPLANQPMVNPETGLITQPWLMFLNGIYNNSSQTTVPDGTVTQNSFATGIQAVGGGASLPSATDYTGPALFYNETDGQLYRLQNGVWTVDVPAAAITGQLVSSQLAADLGIINSVSSLPNPATYTGGPVVLLTKDGNLYRLVGGKWTAAVPAINLTGQLTASQISEINAAQLTGQITSTQISNNAISTPMLQAGSVVTASIAAGAVTASEITVSNLAAISANMGTITTGTLTSGTSYLGTVNASQINASSLSAISANLGTVTAGTLTSGTSYQGTINANQINAGTLNAFTITGSTITGATISGTTSITGATVQSATSGARIVINNLGQLIGYDSSGNISLEYTAGINLEIRDSSNNILFEVGPGLTQVITAIARTADGQTTAISATGTSSSLDAITCPTGGITISNGYLSVTGNITIAAGDYLTSGGYNLIGGETGGSFFLGNTTGSCYVQGANFQPAVTNNTLCGSSSYAWSGGYTHVAFTVTSDRKLKDDIAPESLGIEFIRSLRPVSYRLKNSNDGQIHHGFIAQEVEDALGDVPFAGLVKPKSESDHYGLVYEQFIPAIVKAIQELHAQNCELKSQISQLKRSMTNAV